MALNLILPVSAGDPDGDPLTYRLETGPSSMIIDNATGRMEWQTPPEARGRHQVKVTVEDG